MNIKHRDLLLQILLTLSFMILLFLYFSLPDIEEDIKKNIKNDSVTKIAQILTNFKRHIEERLETSSTKSLVMLLQEDPELRKAYEKELNLLVTTEMQYVYVLYKDKKGKFRFLLDGSYEDKAHFKSKFDIDSEIWNRAYASQRPLLIDENAENKVWITYLYPLVFSGETQGIVSVDFSLSRAQEIARIIVPLKKTLLIVLGLILSVGLFSIIQYLLFYLTRKKAYVDPLTLLFNRQYLHDTLATINYEKYIFAMADIDYFKRINDLHGHKAGDKVLLEVSKELKRSMRIEDTIIRYGGEEFLFLIPQRGLDEKSIVELMERLRKNIEMLDIHVENIRIDPTISIGINAYSSHSKQIDEVIAIADKMLYKAKQMGRNRCVSFHPNMVEQENSRIDTLLSVHEVKDAIEEKRLFCEFQPIFDLKDNTVYKYEALIRIERKDGMTAYPNQFLPNICYSTVYKEMSLALLEICFEKIESTTVAISINLKITDILDDDIFLNMIAHLQKAKEKCSRVTFELLEEEKIEKIELLKERIKKIHDMKASIALDDFGSGYSNFMHVLSLDIDIIKIDGSLIQNIHTSNVSKQLVRSITAFAKASEKTIIAEYVHNEEVLDVVDSLGIEYVQGFLLGKPQLSFLDDDSSSV